MHFSLYDEKLRPFVLPNMPSVMSKVVKNFLNFKIYFISHITLYISVVAIEEE
jgi:hypothetical protein